jgi:hypothetical protein
MLVDVFYGMVRKFEYVGFYELFVLWAGGGGGVWWWVRKGRKYIRRDPRPRYFGSCLTLFHHSSLVNLQKQAVPDIRRKERLRER